MKFKKGQKLVCIHYKDRPKVTVESFYAAAPYTANKKAEVWVRDEKGKLWWGPTTWFKKVRKGR